MVDGLFERGPATTDFPFEKVSDVVVEGEGGSHIMMIYKLTS